MSVKSLPPLSLIDYIAIEGPPTAGKTTLAQHYGDRLGIASVLEDYSANPFLEEMYRGGHAAFETEMTFLLLHYNAIIRAARQGDSGTLIADFSLERECALAESFCSTEEAGLIRGVYQYVLSQIGLPQVTVFIDIDKSTMIQRLRDRSRDHEQLKNPSFFVEYANGLRDYFEERDESDLLRYQSDELLLDDPSPKFFELESVLEKLVDPSMDEADANG